MVLKQSQCMDFLFARTEKSGRCTEVAVGGGSTVLLKASTQPIEILSLFLPTNIFFVFIHVVL